MVAQHVPPPGRPPLEPWERLLRDMALAGDVPKYHGGRFFSNHGLSRAQEDILEASREDVLTLLQEHGDDLMARIREEEHR